MTARIDEVGAVRPRQSPLQRLTGIIPILSVTYGPDERFDVEDIVREVEFLAGFGISAIGIGYGSDIIRQNDAERDELLRIVVDATAGRLPIMCACGGNSIRAAIGRGEAIRAAGADLLMVTPPGAAVQPTPEDVFAYYRRLAEQVGVPIVVQDAPEATGVEMSGPLLARMAREIPGIAALKLESVPAAPKMEAVIAELERAGGTATRPAMLGGSGGTDFFEELEHGAEGTIPGAAIPEVFVQIQKLHSSGDRAAAKALFDRYLPMLSVGADSLDAFLHVQVELLRRRGVVRSGTALREPHQAIDLALDRQVEALAAELGIGQDN